MGEGILKIAKHLCSYYTKYLLCVILIVPMDQFTVSIFW